MAGAIRKGLTPAKILDEAFSMVDAGGAGALTMRALAQRLNVAAMALYNHFRDRDALLDALAEQVFAKLSSRTGLLPSQRQRPRDDWKAKLRALVTSAHKLASRHPHVYRLAMTRPNKPASAFLLSQAAIQLLQRGGVAEKEAKMVYQTFVILLQGYPFWRDAYIRQCEAEGGVQPNADRQFAVSIDWLLGSIDGLVERTGKP